MRNNKGFTLVELLVTITILGIITALAMPGVRRLTSENSEAKFKAYENSILAAAKLYVEDKAVDMSFTGDCASIRAEDLRDNNLIKEFNDKIECLRPSTSYVQVKRVVRDSKYVYEYSAHIRCITNTSGVGDKDVYNTLSATPVC